MNPLGATLPAKPAALQRKTGISTPAWFTRAKPS
jgi:hypothetical protein